MKDELNCSHNGGGVADLLQSVAIHFIHTVCVEIYVRIYNITRHFTAIHIISCPYTHICSKLTGLFLLAERSGVISGFLTPLIPLFNNLTRLWIDHYSIFYVTS